MFQPFAFLTLTILEKELIEKCINGERIACEQLYNHYATKMKRICQRYSVSAFEAEDIFQDAIIKIFQNIKKYEFTGSFDAWVKRIVVHTAINHVKRYANLKHHISCETIEETRGDNVDLADLLSANQLLEVIQKIPVGYRTIFNLYVIEGYSHMEIAEMLTITESSSRSQLCKAKTYLKNMFSKLAATLT